MGIALVAAPGCTEDAVVDGAAAADASQAGADVKVAADTQAGPAPTFSATERGAGPYVEIAGKWDAATKHILVTVWAGGASDMLGLAAHLHYDPEVLMLAGSKMLPIAQQDKVPGTYKTRSVFKDSPPGRLLAGSARFRVYTHPFLVPEGRAVDREPWMELEFAVLGSGKTQLTFDPATVLMRAGNGKEVAAEWLDLNIDLPVGLGGGQ